MIVCLFPKLSLDIRLRMIDAKSGLIILMPQSLVLTIFVVSLIWVVYLDWREKRILIPKNDVYFFVTNFKLRLTLLILLRGCHL